jgi:hypothetical protein
MSTLEFAPIEYFLKAILLVGAVIMAVGYGIRRVYRVARNVDTLVTLAGDSKADRAALEKALAEKDEKFNVLAAKVDTILREVLPNGGSSMKDVVNQTNSRVHDIHARVAVLEQWKQDVA